jgi:hypothetical protein
MDLQQIAKDWNNSGLLIIPAFLDRSAIAELRICDHVLQEAIEVCFTVTVGGSAFRKAGIRIAATFKPLPCFRWATLSVRAGLLTEG